ncbi:DNA glycosylase [Trametes sanguinea]|nr:DNA glycosylase [Trametes sanguinea]
MSTAIPAGFRALPLPLAQLSLAAVLKCGQSFRWSILPLPTSEMSISDGEIPAHEYRLCLRDRVVCLRQSRDTLFYRSAFPASVPGESLEAMEAETLAWVRDYFQLDIDLAELYRQWSLADPVFHRLQDRFEGIRMLRQDPFENLISFICSSNNNIARITKMVKSLCQHYSPPLLSLPHPSGSAFPEETYYPFPSPSALAPPEVSGKLRSLGFGYRADFIQRTAAMLVEAHGVGRHPRTLQEPSEEWLMTLRNIATAEARAELLKFVGVGRKVADCILLMSLDKREVIPVDTHVHQIAIRYYGLKSASKTSNMTPKLYDEVSSKLAAVWGDYAGWAHSVLFTSDLKSFASYGIASTPSTPSLTPDRASGSLASTPSITTPLTETPPTSTKRKRVVAVKRPPTRPPPLVEVADSLPELAADESVYSLAERVKRRRRGAPPSRPRSPAA